MGINIEKSKIIDKVASYTKRYIGGDIRPGPTGIISEGFANIYMPILHNYAYNCIFNVSYIILYILGFGTNALASTHYYSCFFICGY
jgi:hypothetical protein